VDENAKLGIKIPLGDLIILEGFPIGLKRSFWQNKLVYTHPQSLLILIDAADRETSLHQTTTVQKGFVIKQKDCLR